MKKLLSICAAAAIVAACTGGTPTKVENKNNCDCLICEACDSLEYYWALDEEARDSTWTEPYSSNSYKWADSLTTLVYEHLYNNGEYWAYEPTDDLLKCDKFMKIMDEGFDGLCGIEDTTGCISYFYGAYNYYNK